MDNSAVAVFPLAEELVFGIIRPFVMHSSQEKVENRREFFRVAARGGLLGLLIAACGLAVRSPGAAGQRCVNRGLCRGCAVFASCGLPQALSAKNAQPGG